MAIKNMHTKTQSQSNFISGLHLKKKVTPNAHTTTFISMQARCDVPVLTLANENQHLSFKHQKAPRDNLSQINNLLCSERDFIKNRDYNGLNHD